jgi:hypothetical protein
MNSQLNFSLASFAFCDVTAWPCIVVGSIDICIAVFNLLRAFGVLKSDQTENGAASTATEGAK